MSRILLLILAVLPVACSGTDPDPMTKSGTWRSGGSNDANLRVMIADPRDLAEGRGTNVSGGAEAAAPVARLLAGRRFPLPSLVASGINASAEQEPTALTPSGAGANAQGQ